MLYSGGEGGLGDDLLIAGFGVGNLLLGGAGHDKIRGNDEGARDMIRPIDLEGLFASGLIAAIEHSSVDGDG